MLILISLSVCVDHNLSPVILTNYYQCMSCNKDMNSSHYTSQGATSTHLTLKLPGFWEPHLYCKTIVIIHFFSSMFPHLLCSPFFMYPFSLCVVMYHMSIFLKILDPNFLRGQTKKKLSVALLRPACYIFIC